MIRKGNLSPFTVYYGLSNGKERRGHRKMPRSPNGGFMKQTLIVFFFWAIFAGFLSASEVKHRFLAKDESRFQILYVDQFDSSQNWTIEIPAGSRDMRLIDGKIVIGLRDGGFAEYDFASQKRLREVVDPKYKAVSVGAYRLEDGRTLLASDQSSVRITMLDVNGKELSTTEFPNTKGVRYVRPTRRGTVLFGCNENHVIEGTLDGTIIRDNEIPDANYVYMIEELPNGNLLATTAYGGFFVELDKDGKIVRKIGGKPGPEGVGINFFAGFQVLKNGNVMVANWTGHGANDSEKGIQLLEYDPTGNIVWRWHDPKNAGSIHHVVVLE